MQVTLQDAKTHFPELIEAVRHGETVIIEQGGNPIAKLTPRQPKTEDSVWFDEG